MSHWLRRSALVWLAALARPAAAQRPGRGPEREDDSPPRMPDGRNQREEILKAEYEQTLKDADHLVELSHGLKDELEKNGRHLLAIATLKRLDDIEKLVRRIRGRLRHN